MSFVNLVIPVFIVFVFCFGLYKKVNVFDTFIEGAKGGLKTTANILPALVLLMLAIYMFRRSGALELLTGVLQPVLSKIGMPPELVPLTILRPISGSGALAIIEDLMAQHGSDSTIGRIAGVMMGSTETTFYTIAVYYGAAKIKKTSYTLPCALVGDIAGFTASVIAVRLLFS